MERAPAPTRRRPRGRARAAPLALTAGVLGLLAGCPPAHVPGPADTAAYLGLADGAVQTYADVSGNGGNVTETHEVHTSSVLPAADNPDGLVFDVLAKRNGFAVDGRTFTLEVLVDSARIVRFFDCIEKCGQPSAPVDLGPVPLKAGKSTQTEVDVDVTGADVGTSHETHLFVVGDQADVGVPAGDFSAFSVTWTRTDADGAHTSILKIAPDDGIVSWDGEDGAQLRLQ